MLTTPSAGLRDLGALIGREESLHSFHGAVSRAAHTLRPVVECGAVLASCSDEFNGELRGAFARDVAAQLPAPGIPGARRVFAVSNLGGRIEPGAIALANLHFTARSAREGEKLLLIEIASHVGRRETAEGTRWGELDRFGTPSPCCGALRLLLDAPESAAAVRFPWFDQLTAFFGPARLAVLRADKGPHAMVRAAIVHAVLQSETTLVDLMREPPSTPTHVLLVALVVVNRVGTDNAIAVGLHHLRFAHGEVELLQGTALRSTPDELVFDTSRANVRVRSSFAPEPEHAHAPAHPHPHLPSPAALPAAAATARHRARDPAVRKQVERSRRHLERLRGHPHAFNVYARATLRAFLQGLSVVAPEVGLAALALESGREIFKAARMEELLRHGPSSEAARKVLHDLEPNLQQLGHREAREVLEILLSHRHPLLGD